MTDLLAGFRLAALPTHAEAFRAEVRAFLAEALPDAPASRRARSWMGRDAGFSRKLAARGWVGVTLAREWGGAQLDAFQRFVLVEELLCAGAPVGSHWIADRQSGPLIQRFGSAAQKAFYLPRICRGEAFFCIGMSEPDAGSDLASVSSRARRTERGWTLDGRKIWTSGAQHAHYMIALVRTSGTREDRQQGLSQFIVDMHLPGVLVRPIRDISGDEHFNEVFLDGVELDADALVGQEGEGWKQVNAELAFERSGPERIYSSMVLLEQWLQALRRRPGAREDSATLQLLGRLVTQLAALRRMSIAVTARLVAGESPLVESALVKDLGTEFEQSVPDLIAATLGLAPLSDTDPDLHRTLAFVAQMAPSFSLRGGTREILRGMIARGLGLR